MRVASPVRRAGGAEMMARRVPHPGVALEEATGEGGGEMAGEAGGGKSRFGRRRGRARLRETDEEEGGEGGHGETTR